MLQAIRSWCISRRELVLALFFIVLTAFAFNRLSIQGAMADEPKAGVPASKAFEKRDSSAVLSTPPLPSKKPALPQNAQLVQAREDNQVWIYPPIDLEKSREERVPTVMMLHGMCGDPLSVCDFWNKAGREGSFLLCPEGNVSCGDARDWKGSGAEKAQALDSSFSALQKAYGDYVAPAGEDILIGFSRGAFVARDVAYERKGRFRGLILIGAQMLPDAKRLKESGIRRVVMAAGDFDMASPSMRRAASTMSALGLPTRYVSLGRIPHTLPANLESILRDALRWIREENPS